MEILPVLLSTVQKSNALSIELSDMLVEAIQAIKKSTDTKFVVIKGAGNTFCAGDDIKEMFRWGDDEHGKSTQGANGVMRRVRIYQDMANTLENLDKLTISAVEWGLWNRVVPDDKLDDEVEALLDVLRCKNLQACRQLKYIINRGCDTDLYTAQGFEILSAGLSGAVNGFWEVADADQGSGVRDFTAKGDLWKNRRSLSKDFWVD